MLRIKEIKKYNQRLGFPAGKEVRIRPPLEAGGFARGPIYVKYGRELSKHDPSSPDRMAWNVTLFDTALNHPQRPWTVVAGVDGKPMVLGVRKEGLGFSEDDPPKSLGGRGEELASEDYSGGNSTIVLVKSGGKDFAVGLDDLKELNSFGISVGNGKLSLGTGNGVMVATGGVLPVEQQDGSVAYMAVNNEAESVLYKLDAKGLQPKQKIDLKVPVNAKKILLTKNNELLHISPQGLNVYSVEGSSSVFKYFCPYFSSFGGWNQRFVDTVSLMSVDEKQEALIGTGPKGIEYMPVSEKCTNYVIEGTQDAKHAVVAEGATKTGNEIKIVGVYNGELCVLTLEAVDVSEPKLEQKLPSQTPEKPFKATKSTKVTVRSGAVGKPVRWLRDSLDEASFKNIVDKLTGKVRFSFPLVDLQDRMGLPIKLMVYYDETDSEEMSVLGRHWTLGRDCIVLDHGNTVFEDKQDYYLVKDQMKIKLQRDWTKPVTNGKISFIMAGNQDATIVYTAQEDKWEISDGKIRYVYGINNQGAVSVPGWNDWYGPSAKFDQKTMHSVQWNLVEINSVKYRDLKIKYTYTPLDPSTNTMHLLSISDDSDKTSIKFSYKNIEGLGKQVESGLVKEHKFINNKLLEKVEINSPSTAQVLTLKSTKIDSLYYLQTIYQEGDSDPVLGFEYYKDDKLKPRVQQIQLPSKSLIDYKYTKQLISTDRFVQEIEKMADLYTGNEYSLEIEKTAGEKELSIKLRDSAGRNDFIKNQSIRIISYKSFKIKSYSPFMMHNYIAVVVRYAEKDDKIHNKIYIINKGDGDSWKLDAMNESSRVSEDKKFKYDFQEDSFVYYHSKKVHFEFKKAGSKVWTYTSKDIADVDALTLTNRGAVYCKDDLSLIRWDVLGNPRYTTLSDAKSKPTTTDVETFFQYIDIQGTYPEEQAESKKEVEDYKRDLKESLNDNGLVLYNNVVAVRTIKLSQSGKIAVKLFLYLLKPDYSVSSRSTIDLQGGDISKFNLTLDVLDEQKTKNTKDLDKYRFEFQKSGEKFKLKFIEATDKEGKPTKPSSENEKLIPQYERRMKIPLDFEKYMMQVNHDGIIVNDQHIFHDNGKFGSQPLDRDTLKLTKFKIPLGAFSNFKKDSDGDEIKLCTKTELDRTENCVSLQTNAAQNVSIKYPYYLVTQKQNNIKVLPLKINSRGWEDSIDYNNEILHGSSSHAVMVTTRMSDQKTIVRPLKSLNKNNKIFAHVVSEEKLTTPFDNYQIKYEYDDPVISMNDVAFRTAIVVPGGDKTVTGYYKETNDLQANQQIVQVMTTDTEVFDPEYVKRMNEMQQEESKQRDRPQMDAEQTITDKSGFHPLLKTTPYSANQNMVQFLGFEDYEDMTGWTVNQRPIPDANIRRNEFSATGRNFLLLNKGQELIAEFPNTPYYDHFIASTWIRTTQDSAVGSQTNLLTLSIDGNPIQATIKQTIDEWIYVEADTKNTAVSESDTVKRVTFKISVKPTGNEELHVDHVRLSPVNYNFEGSVYDSRIGQRTATIKTNGFVSRRLFDAYNRRIAEIDESGNIKYLASYSKRVGTKKDEKKREGGNSSRVQIRAKQSWLESFSPYTMEKRWQISGSTTVEPYQAILQGTLSFNHKFTSESVCVRLVYSIGGDAQLKLTIGKATVSVTPNAVQYKSQYTTPTSNAELIVFTTPKLTSVWVDGHLAMEVQESNPKFNNEVVSLQASGSVGIKDLVVMEGAEIQVSYMNRDSKPLQEIIMLDSNNILIRQMMYDVIGRKVAETVWVQKSLEDRSEAFRALQYHENFVTNDNSSSVDYFLNTGLMKGHVEITKSMYDGYPYSQTLYYNNPLEIRKKVGQPGLKNSVNGDFAHQYAIASDLPFIQKHYPKSEGFRQEEERSPNGKKHVVVYNRRNKKVAEYTQVKDYNNILTTYVYDEHGNQIQMLPPSYYNEQSKSGNYQPEKQVVASPWAVNSKYDSTGELITSKETPDGGRVEFIYNEYNQLRYQIHYAENKKADKIVYFVYNIFGRVCEAGQVPANPTTEQLVKETMKSHQAIPQRDQAVYLDYGETESEPSLRGRIQRTVKQNKEVLFSEVLYFDEESNVIRKSYISPTTNETLSIEYLQENDKVSGIQYPFGVDGKQLILKYKHNLRGEIVEVSRVDEKTNGHIDFIPIAGIYHDAEGKVTKISHKYGDNKFDQSYKYVAPGYLVEIANDFLTEKLYYTEKGYGCEPTGDGSILRTEFKASWHEKCDQNLIPLTARAFVSGGIDFNTAESCFDALFNLGYIDTSGRPVKTFYPDLETRIPLKCATPSNWRHISERMLEQGYPEHYGHAYDYGSHGELIAAKSFVGLEKDNLVVPLSKASFAKAGFSSDQELKKFWDSLRGTINKVEGTRAVFEGSQQLSAGSVGSVIHKPKLDSLLGNRADSTICSSWANGDKTEEGKCKKEYQPAFDKLNLKQVIRSLPDSVRKNVLGILKNTLASVLGNSPGDVESFSIDPNGNHGVFYTGFKRFELKYKSRKNQIESIKEGIKQQDRQIVHDDEGNVIKALHKNIDKIEYDPLTRRVSRIEMSNKSRILEFGYDFRGERTLKRVRNKDNDIISVNYYVRDNKGNVLVEYKQEYPNPKDTNKPINTVTAYIHGPLGLLGFFRNNKYYNVLLDHEGSTRLVINNGKVVAAYDYLPYGQTIRKYGSNPEAHIAFRYTGQELDEETGLYNYHARLYDPDIGRFFQMDPMEQYASPYKYAGNSPVSQIDPDGQIAVTLVLMIVGAIVGAYLGAASANNSWNPAKWAWGDKKTWIGLFAGALMGAFAVYGGAASFSYFTAMFGGSMVAGALATGVISVAGAFLGAAAASNQWNPAKWDWTSPAVWNGLLTGASIAVSFPSGFVGITRSFMSITSNLVRTIYASLMFGGFLLFVYLGGAMANQFNFQISQWDWKSPRTWFGMIEGASTIFMGTSGTAKHGAKKWYTVVEPQGFKMPWHRANIPTKAYRMQKLKDIVIIKWYKNGQFVSKQILKTTVKADLAKIPKDYLTAHKAFFMPYQRIGYAAIAMPSMAGLMFQKYQYFFTNHPNGTLTKPVRRKRSVYTTASSAATPSLSSFLNYLFDATTELFGSFFFKSDHSETESTNSLSFAKSFQRHQNKSHDKSIQKLCYAPDSKGNQIICPQRESTVNIFSKSVTFGNSEIFGQDLFSRCLPLTWNDRPSIVCDGQETTFIYTPVQSLRVFDMVDGWLLLARIAPASMRNLKSGLSFLKDVVFGRGQVPITSVEDEVYCKEDLRLRLSDLKQLMAKQPAKAVSWAHPVLSDLEDDIHEFLGLGNPSDVGFALLQERLTALREDIMEVTTTVVHVSYMTTLLEGLVKNHDGAGRLTRDARQLISLLDGLRPFESSNLLT